MTSCFVLLCCLKAYGEIWVPKYPLNTHCKQTYIFGKWLQGRRQWLWMVKARFWQGAATFPRCSSVSVPAPRSATVTESEALRGVSVLGNTQREPLTRGIKHRECISGVASTPAAYNRNQLRLSERLHWESPFGAERGQPGVVPTPPYPPLDNLGGRGEKKR